ncbi:MAG TPA: hypothetical protein VJZ27_07725, partial [Aggregatilineales bacterium]|nr:hypothetical protein [Aggregatilineales bacterium]
PPIESRNAPTFRLQLWDVKTGELLNTLSEGTLFNGLTFSQDGTLLNTISPENVWQIWGAP